jgi:tRNA (adenine22-N1)-methyltransferase
MRVRKNGWEIQSMKISKRLKHIIALVPKDARLADIGSDHAFVPIKLAQTGQIDFAIASEVAAGPLDISKENIAAQGVSAKVQTRLGSGFDPFTPADKLNTFVIAGMGGELITSLLEAADFALLQPATLILEPNNQEHLVRQWLNQHQMAISQEEIVAEDNHYYEIIVARYQAEVKPLSATDLQFGPRLRRQKSAVFVDKWTHRLQVDEQVLAQLSAAKTVDFTRVRELEQDVKAIEGVLA